MFLGLSVSGVWGQNYLGLDGGFEGSATIDNTNVQTAAQANKWTKNNATTTLTNETSTVRSGSNALKVRNTSTTGRRIWAPLMAVSTSSQVVIQYYRRVASISAQECQEGINRNGTESLSGSYGNGTANTWTKVTYAPTGTTATANALWGVITTRVPSGGSAGDMFIDDVCIYVAASADASAPNAPTLPVIGSPTTSSLNVAWTAASGGVDNGGYLVVRGLADPTTAPNANGIYAVTNTIASGMTVVYQGTGTSFTDTGLSSGTQYFYRIYTYDKAYNYSGALTGNGTTSGVGTPTLSVNALSDFGNKCINNSLGSSSFTITGSSLTTDNVLVEALTGYTYSTAWDGTFSSSLSLNQSGGGYTQEIFVKFTPTAAQTYNGNIVISGGGAASVNRSVTGSGVNSAPTVTTTSPATSITSTTVTLSGNVGEVGCQSITARGICYGTSASPDINGTKTTETGSTGAFSSNITNLSPTTLYYFRAYATSSAGTSYGSEYTFTTLTPTITVGTVTAFGNQTVNTTSTEKSYAVSGANLISDVTITPPAGFEVSLTSGSGFVASPSTISLSPSSGTLASTTIYVRFKPTAVSAYSSININLTATSAVTKTTAVSGTGVAPTDPTSVSATAASYNQINLSFTPNGSNNVVVAFNTTNTFGTPTGAYSVTDAISGGGTVIYKGTGSSFSHTALSANTVYYYKVWTVDALNFYSAGVSTNATTNNLTAPVAIDGSSITSSGFTANWDAVGGASSYKLDVTTNNNFSTSQTIASESFENSLTLFTETSGTGTFYTGNSGSSDGPSTSSFSTVGTYGYGKNNGNVTISSNSINTSVYSNVQLVLKLASFSIGGATNGADVGDIVTVQVSPDGTNFYSTIRVLGNSNAYWAFSANGNASTTYDGDANSVDFQSASGVNGYSTITISGLPSSNNLKVRITLLNNSTSEQWVVDDFKITGNLSDLLNDYNNLNIPTSTSTSVSGLSPNTTYYYRVRATSANSTSANSNVITITTLASYSIAVSSSDVAKGSVSGGGAKDAGASVSLTATPASASYRFVNWTEGGNFASAANPYTFSASVGRTLVANFADMAAPIAISTETNASTFADCATCDVTVSAGAKLTIDESKTFNSVTVAAGGQVSLASGSTLTSPVTLQSSASGTATFVNENTGAQSIAGVVENYLAHTRNWYVSSPVSNAVAQAGYTYYQRDETGASWTSKPFAQDSVFLRGHGYIALPGSVASKLTFNGTLNHGNIPVYLTASGASSTGFNLIGNPYPAHLTWTKAFVDANSTLIEPTIYYRTTTGTLNNVTGWSFKSINASTGEVSPVGTTAVIPPMQAFWIKAKQTGTLTLNSSLTRSHETGNPLKVPASVNTDRKRLRLQVSNGDVRTDETLIYFDSQASDSYDSFDSPRFEEANTVTQLYSLVGSRKLVINGMNSFSDNTELPLGFVAGTAGTFNIAAIQFTNFESDVQVLLKDQKSGAIVDLRVGGYMFTSDALNDTNRFSVVFRTQGSANGLNNTMLNTRTSVFVNANGELIVNTAATLKSGAYVSVYNAIGQQISIQPLTSSYTIATAAKAAGVYWVKISNDGEVVTRKVVLK